MEIKLDKDSAAKMVETCDAILDEPCLTFSFEFKGNASRLRTGGDVSFDRERKQWRATIIAQREPELRFDAWDDDPAIASLVVCAKWMGRDISNAD